MIMRQSRIETTTAHSRVQMYARWIPVATSFSLARERVECASLFVALDTRQTAFSPGLSANVLASVQTYPSASCFGAGVSTRGGIVCVYVCVRARARLSMVAHSPFSFVLSFPPCSTKHYRAFSYFLSPFRSVYPRFPSRSLKGDRRGTVESMVARTGAEIPSLRPRPRFVVHARESTA